MKEVSFLLKLGLVFLFDVFIMFHVSAPSSPRNVKVLSTLTTSIQLSWWEPARPNGIVKGYRLYFKHNNLTSVQPVSENTSAVVETLHMLSK